MDKLVTSIPRQKFKKSFYVGHDTRLPETRAASRLLAFISGLWVGGPRWKTCSLGAAPIMDE